jgi:2-aminoadipate transaminase
MSQSTGLPFSAKARRTTEQPISFLIETAMRNPHLINFAAGLVDPRTLPVEETREIGQKIFSDSKTARAALQYDTTQGLAPLRRELLKHLEELEGKPAASMGVTADHLVVTNGSQQSLYLVADTLVDPGDIIIAENPSYFVYTGALASFGAKVLTAPMDDQGMDIETVAHLLNKLDKQGQLPRVKFIYVTSYYQNPTGLTLSLERRAKLLDLVRSYAKKHRIIILEDAAYRELRYDGPALPSIKSMEAENVHTVAAYTFSKPFAPGVKTGYSAMPADLLEAVLHQKGNHDFGSSSLNQYICLEAMRSGAYAKHVEVLRKDYKSKRDAVLAALEKYMPSDGSVKWTHPGGGLYTWVTLPKSINASREGMFKEAVDAGVLYVPGDYCMQADESGEVPKHSLRISFGQVAPEKIEEGIEKLADVVSRQLSLAATATPS